MLGNHDSSAIVAVRDLERARRFYQETLGLEPLSGDESGPMVFRTGATRLCVYRSEFAGTNQANAAVWGVGEALERIVGELRRKGVRFERYEMQGATFADGIHRFGDFRAAWFRDPDGNVLHLNSGG